MGNFELILISDTFSHYKIYQDIDGSLKKWANSPQFDKKGLLIFNITFLTFIVAYIHF